MRESARVNRPPSAPPVLVSALVLLACAPPSGGSDASTTADVGGTGTASTASGSTASEPTTTGPTSATGGSSDGTSGGDTVDPTGGTTGDPGVTMYDVEPGILASAVMPGFCQPEVYVKDVDGKPEYWLRDAVENYGDPRPRTFYVDYSSVGQTLDYGPILRGGVYSVRCLRFAGDVWWNQPGTLESHVVWFRIPGPMMEPGQVPVPASFQVQDNFIVDQTGLLPAFSPIAGKINLVYKWWDSDSLDDIYSRGATHVSAQGDPGEPDPQKLGLTSAVYVNAPWMDQLGVNPSLGNLDGLGEQGFRKITDAQMDEAVAQQPSVGLYFFDLEKSPNYGDPATYWSIDVESDTLPRYHRLMRRFRETNPARLLGDYYRNIVWTKGFNSPDDGNPMPEHPKFVEKLNAPQQFALAPAYRDFTEDGQTKSLRDVVDLYTVDVYPARGHGPFDLQPDKADRSWSSYQLYSMIYDTILIRKLVPDGAKVLWFGWAQSDNDQPTRLFVDLPTGRASYMVRHPLPASWAQTVEMLGYIVGDGYHWWTEQIRRGNDPARLGTGDGDPQWEPLVPGTPAPWTWAPDPNGTGAYPRIHEYAFSYGKLAQFQVKQIEDRLGDWTFASYTLPDTPGSQAKGDATILQLAIDRLPIVLLLGEPGKRALFAVHPFGDYRERYELTVDVDGTPTPLTLSGKWPSLVALP